MEPLRSPISAPSCSLVNGFPTSAGAVSLEAARWGKKGIQPPPPNHHPAAAWPLAEVSSSFTNYSMSFIFAVVTNCSNYRLGH